MVNRHGLQTPIKTYLIDNFLQMSEAVTEVRTTVAGLPEGKGTLYQVPSAGRHGAELLAFPLKFRKMILLKRWFGIESINV